MWIIAKITPAVNWPGLLCPAIAKNQGGPGPCAPLPFLRPCHVRWGNATGLLLPVSFTLD